MIVIDDNLGNSLMTTPFSRNDILDDIVTLAVVTIHPYRYPDDDGHGSHASRVDALACAHKEDVLEALGEVFEDP